MLLKIAHVYYKILFKFNIPINYDVTLTVA